MRHLQLTTFPVELINRLDETDAIIGGGMVADYFQMKTTEDALLKVGDTEYQITCLGLISIDEAGGKEHVMKLMRMKNEQQSKFQIHKDWFSGFGKLYVYLINKIK